MATSDSESRSGLVLELAEEFLARYRAGERPAAQGIHRPPPRLGRRDPRSLPGDGDDGAHRVSRRDDGWRQSNGAVTIPHLEQLGDYRVLREVGRGGMGVVYEAEQVSLGRHVALKVLPPHSLRDDKQRRRFEREARAAARLHHTNIVPVFGVGEQEETPYYVMQFIQGQGLDAVLDELKRLRAARKAAGRTRTKKAMHGRASIGWPRCLGGRRGPIALDRPLRAEADETEPADSEQPSTITGDDERPRSGTPSPRRRCRSAWRARRGKSKRQTYWEGIARIGIQVADALAYAARSGNHPPRYQAVEPAAGHEGDGLGGGFRAGQGSGPTEPDSHRRPARHAAYMPPEAFGGKTDARGDIYSLGLTLYEMLAFRPAFDESDRGRLVRQVTNEEPPRLKKLNPEVPRDLETIVQKAIERDPSHRYPSASELAEDLRRFVDDEPIQARRASVVERVARWGRRNPANGVSQRGSHRFDAARDRLHRSSSPGGWRGLLRKRKRPSSRSRRPLPRFPRPRALPPE